MDQIPQSIINSILGGALAALGWFARQIWDAIKELTQESAGAVERLARFDAFLKGNIEINCLYTVLQIGTGEGNPKARGVI